MTNKFFSIKKDLNHTCINILGCRIKFRKKIKAVVFIDCGGIGDYIIQRKYLRYLRQSPKFSGYKLVYLSKFPYRNIFNNYDKDIFDEIVFYSGIPFKELKKKLKKYSFDYLINLFTLNEKFDFSTWVVRRQLFNIKAKCKITGLIASENWEKNKNTKIWDKLIVLEPNCFELEGQRQFFEKLLEIPIPQEDTSMQPLCDFKKDYIVISLFANNVERNFSNEKWAYIINHILQNSNDSLQLLFVGVDMDRKGLREILKNVDDKHNRCKDLIGLTDVSLLPSLLAGAKFLLAIETGTVHIANAVNTKVICLSSGSFYGRFLPYSSRNVEYIFPEKFQHLIDTNNQTELQKVYTNDSPWSPADIDVEQIIKVVDRHLKNI